VLAIPDPLLKLVRLRDANDYAEVSRTLEPVVELARRSGCHIMAVHHLGKGERSPGDAVLGSTALFGAVDTLVAMKRRDNLRTLETIQRYGEDFPETVLTLDADTGVISPSGEMAAVKLQEAENTVLDAVGDEALTERDLRERIGGNQTMTAKAIRSLVDSGGLLRAGEGKRGDPYIYRSAASLTVSDDSRFSGLPPIENRGNREIEKPDEAPPRWQGAATSPPPDVPPYDLENTVPTCATCERPIYSDEAADADGHCFPCFNRAREAAGRLGASA
jgi:hypothetical protein